MNNLEMLLQYFSVEPEALAKKLSAQQCDECCVGCKALCKKTNHGDKGCIDTILEWLKEEAPWPCQNAYITRIEQERKRWVDTFDKIKAEIEPKCDRINSLASVLPYAAHREIQELLCEIMDLCKVESEDV